MFDWFYILYLRYAGVVYYSASGGWIPTGPPSNYTPPYCDEDWSVGSVPGLAHWTPTPTDIAAQRTKLDLYHGTSGLQSYGRFLPDKDYIAALAPSGYNVWQRNGIIKTEPAEYYGPDKSRFFSKEAMVYDSPNKGGAKHHPSKAGHIWRGESIAFLLALTLLDAVYMIERDRAPAAGGAVPSYADLNTQYTAHLSKIQGPLPAPKSCSPVSFCESRATCYTDFTPHFNKQGTLRELVLGSSEWVAEGSKYYVCVGGGICVCGYMCVLCW